MSGSDFTKLDRQLLKYGGVSLRISEHSDILKNSSFGGEVLPLDMENLVHGRFWEPHLVFLAEAENEKPKHICSVNSPCTNRKNFNWTASVKHFTKIDVLAVHCVIHRQHLVGRNASERQQTSLQYVISLVNKIRRNSRNSRLFNQQCTANDEDSNRLFLHTDVCWLSISTCLTWFYNLLTLLIKCLENRYA
nr:unnamed protein product [Callosobruchus chinensis]